MLKTGPCWSLLWGHRSRDLKKNLKDKEKCEEGNRQCNIGNVLKRRIIPSHKNEMGYVQPHTTPQTTQICHIKIHTRKNPYHCALCGKGSISSSHIKSHIKSHAKENLNPCALCGRKFISRNHSKIHSKRNTGKNPYHCTMCGKGLISRNHTKRHMKSLARENLYQCVLCGNRIVETSKVQKIIAWKGRLKITKWKGTKNIKPKVQKSKISQNISNILGHNLYPISVLYVVMKLIKVY